MQSRWVEMRKALLFLPGLFGRDNGMGKGVFVPSFKAIRRWEAPETPRDSPGHAPFV